jgi:hypothetical protein
MTTVNIGDLVIVKGGKVFTYQGNDIWYNVIEIDTFHPNGILKYEKDEKGHIKTYNLDLKKDALTSYGYHNPLKDKVNFIKGWTSNVSIIEAPKRKLSEGIPVGGSSNSDSVFHKNRKERKDTVVIEEPMYNFPEEKSWLAKTVKEIAVDEFTDWKYEEDVILEDLRKYLESTYGEHYVGEEDNNIECFDAWIALGNSGPTFRNTALKYLWRYGKKEGKNKKDLMKALQYVIMLLYVEHYKK